MEYRRLGSTGVKVSTHCLGAMMFGEWGNKDHDESIKIIHAAIDGGINFIDTADVYSAGESEEIVGKALKGKRDDVVLATKFHGAMGPGINDRGNSRYWIMKEVENSLRRLQTDHIDLYQVHRPNPKTDVAETLGALDTLVQQGKIRYAGASTFPAWMIVESQSVSERRGIARFVCEQPPYSIFVRHHENELFPVTQRYGMGVIVWSPLAGGWLAGRYRRDQDAPPDSRAVRFKARGSPVAARYDVTRPGNQRKLDIVEDLLVVADKAGQSLTHMSIAFSIAHSAVTSTIIGPRTLEQLEDLLAGADLRLDEETLDAIDDLVPPGSVLEGADVGWVAPWMDTSERRRPPWQPR